ncbi:MAG: sulfate adenylyltransferase subunit CysN [Victivallales bacterium]|nr:sulfate adenylyltransferase subunit CysN [Victivallales bacterium]
MDIDGFLNQHENKDLLRFITCGSVDDGKSTLIGRLLYDSKLIFEDQIRALRNASETVGTTQGTGEIDYALLMDGLKAEREQGITIDVAYRYFSTPKRKFIIADTPGHEQYTRNMATGASTANLAVVLIDARQGILTQTKRHSFIVSLLGIKHVVVAVNKMDLVDFSEKHFLDIRQEFDEFLAKLDITDVTYIPVSALKGDNVIARSEKTPWYDGPPILEYLENVDASDHQNENDFRFPVQYVVRPDLDFRGFAGSVLSGAVKKGDRVRVLPSRKESTVKAIVTYDGDLEEAFAPQAGVIVLEDEIDISSGDMIVHANNLPNVTNQFEAVLVWMNETALSTGTPYILRQAGRNTKATVGKVSYRIDVNTLQKSDNVTLGLNEIGKVTVFTTQPIFHDPYSKNRETGGFVLIDAITNTTVAAGMITEGVVSDPPIKESYQDADLLQQHIDRREVQWDTGYVSSRERTLRNHHKGKAIIVTGGDGHESLDLAKRVERELFRRNMNSYYLGITNLLGGLDADLGDGFAARDEHLRRLGELARIMTDAGLIFIAAATDADEVDLGKLKLLSQPNELLIVTVGKGSSEQDADLCLADIAEDEQLQAVFQLLSAQNIIPEYCI